MNGDILLHKKLKICAAVAAALAVVLGIGSLHDEKRPSSVNAVSVFEVQYAADFSDDRVLVGASHNIFVGKVVKQIGTKGLSIGPEMQFEVEVVENIKGDLSGRVVVNQQGGYRDGVLHMIAEGEALAKEQRENYLLQPGFTYLLATRLNEQEGWHTLNPYPTASKLLSKDAKLRKDELKEVSKLDVRFRQLQEAYPVETILDADIKNGRAHNSYKGSRKAQ